MLVCVCDPLARVGVDTLFPFPLTRSVVFERDDVESLPAATLCHLVDGDETLLIHKKRGVGEGLYNGVGGKVEPDETVREAAVREVEEEVRATPTGLADRGELDFRFGGEPFMYVHVFVADGLVGTPEETPEADPAWTAVDDVPYDEMWADDRHWLPHVLDGRSVAGRFRFSEGGERLLDWRLETESVDAG